jgi:hypothetical protein
MHSQRNLQLHLLSALFALIFSLLAFIFSLLAINSKQWAVRNNYNPLYGPKNWTETNIIYTLYRSPFIICSAAQTDANSSSGGGDVQNPTYTVTCRHFRPFGFDRTSCEEEVATQDDTAPNLGDTRLCQQIHYAGNFGITSTFFISLGFIIIGIVMIATFSTFLKSTRTEDEPREPRSEERRRAEDQNGIEEEETPNSRVPAEKSRECHHSQHHSAVLPYLNLTLLMFISIGVISALISQFYAVEGLIQSAYNNADFSTSQGTSSAEVLVSGIHGPWYQGKALSVYATCAW